MRDGDAGRWDFTQHRLVDTDRVATGAGGEHPHRGDGNKVEERGVVEDQHDRHAKGDDADRGAHDAAIPRRVNAIHTAMDATRIAAHAPTS